MGRKDENPHSPKQALSEESLVIQELRRRLAEPGPWPQRFRRLAQAIAATPLSQQGPPPAPNCQECIDLLDLYVDAELQGHPVQSMYPLVRHHLHTCPRCQEAHHLLSETLDLERRDQLPSIPGLGPNA